ncbi:MAG: hypothetical protein KDC57_12555 [Saprospiraceae bacterium]|nr:hypothetical protein [Saprospiraceae bacterium]
MLNPVFAFELRRLLRQPATYIYLAVFFTIALISILGTGGYFDGPPDESDHSLLNAPYELISIYHYFNKLLLFLLPAIIGLVIHQDYKYDVYPILYSYPIRKSRYLLGKFVSALMVVMVLSLSIGLAFLLGELMLGRDHPRIGPFNLTGYALAYGVFILPNLFMYGLMVFIAVGTFRTIYAGFMIIILLILVQIITNNLFANNPSCFALFDPFGQNAFIYETRLWTPSDQNTRSIPVMGLVLGNRALWAFISISLFGYFFRIFKLEQEPLDIFSGYRKKKSTSERPPEVLPSVLTSDPKMSGQAPMGMPRFRTMLILAVKEFKYIIKNWLFYLMLIFGIMALIFAMSRVTNRGEVTFLPLTRIMLSTPMFFFSTIIILLTIIYAGMLVHRSRMAKMNELIDTTAIGNWTLFGAKFLALLQSQALLLIIMMLCGIVIQLYNGFYHFEIWLYLFHLFIITFPVLIVWAALSVFIHSILPNMYLSIFLLLLTWMGKDVLPQLGIKSQLVRFNSPPSLTYSDLNGFGHGLMANYLVNAYWLTFSGILVFMTYLFWRRGYVLSWQESLKIARNRLTGRVLGGLLLLFLLFVSLAFGIFRDENRSNNSVGNDKQVLEEFRSTFGKYRKANQPDITSVNLRIDLFPEKNAMVASGDYLLENKSDIRIDTLLIKTGFDEITRYSIDAPSKIIQYDQGLQFTVHILESPLAPGDSIHLHFDIRNKPNTIFYSNSSVLNNGTFLQTDILPRFGYFFAKEFYLPDDSLVREENLYAPDAGLVAIETLISTDSSQTAIAPGTLLNQWVKNGRNYFHYKTKEKIKFALSLNSGVFTKYQTRYRGIDLEIYHNKNHPYNLKDMSDGLSAALDYNTKYFRPFPFQTIKTIEFPLTEGTQATLTGNVIPTSEVRFILKNDTTGPAVNWPFYVEAHELTHQWWGNQLMPANCLGAKMLTESITEYISLRIYEHHFGQEKAQHFLSLQERRYLQGRTKETGQENPLYLAQPDQDYLIYGKGALAFNALQYYVGEDNFNHQLKIFLDRYQSQNGRYPTSIDLINHLKNSIPVDYHYIIKDLMESVTFYDIRIINVLGLKDDKMKISFRIDKSDQSTNKELTSNVYLTIGQYDQKDKELRLESYKASLGENKLIIPRDPRATKIVLDPLLHFIELDLKDNILGIPLQ